MKKLREILVTQYIGAVTIGVALAQAISGFINAIVQAGAAYVAIRQSQSVLATSREFSWRNLIVSTIGVILYVLISMALIRWLYAGPSTEPSTKKIADAGRRDETNQ